MILPVDRLRDIVGREPMVGENLGRDVDVDLLILVAEDRDLLDALHAQEPVARGLGEGLQLRIAEAVAGDRVQGDEGVAELVVEIGAEQALRQFVRDIAGLLAHLIEGVGDFRRAGVARDVDLNDGAAGAGEGFHVVEMRRFLQLALDLVDDLILHVGERGAGPDRLHDHHAEGEVRVFLLADPQEAENAGEKDRRHEDARDAGIPDRPAGEIEAAFFAHGASPRLKDCWRASAPRAPPRPRRSGARSCLAS